MPAANSFDRLANNVNLTEQDLEALARLAAAEARIIQQTYAVDAARAYAMAMDSVVNRVAAERPYSVYGTTPNQLANSNLATSIQAAINQRAQYEPVLRTPNNTWTELAPAPPEVSMFVDAYTAMRERGMPAFGYDLTNEEEASGRLGTHFANLDVSDPKWADNWAGTPTILGTSPNQHVGGIPAHPRTGLPEPAPASLPSITTPVDFYDLVGRMPLDGDLFGTLLSKAGPEQFGYFPDFAATVAPDLQSLPDVPLDAPAPPDALPEEIGPEAWAAREVMSPDEFAQSLEAGSYNAFSAPPGAFSSPPSPPTTTTQEAAPASPAVPPGVNVTMVRTIPTPEEEAPPSPPGYSAARMAQAFSALPGAYVQQETPYPAQPVEQGYLSPLATEEGRQFGLPPSPPAAPFDADMRLAEQTLFGTAPVAPVDISGLAPLAEQFGPAMPTLAEQVQARLDAEFATPFGPFANEIPDFGDQRAYAPPELQAPLDLSGLGATQVPSVPSRFDLGMPPGSFDETPLDPRSYTDDFGLQMALGVAPQDFAPNVPAIGLTGTPSMGFPSFGSLAPPQALSMQAMLDNFAMAQPPSAAPTPLGSQAFSLPDFNPMSVPQAALGNLDMAQPPVDLSGLAATQVPSPPSRFDIGMPPGPLAAPVSPVEQAYLDALPGYGAMPDEQGRQFGLPGVQPPGAFDVDMRLAEQTLFGRAPLSPVEIAALSPPVDPLGPMAMLDNRAMAQPPAPPSMSPEAMFGVGMPRDLAFAGMGIPSVGMVGTPEMPAPPFGYAPQPPEAPALPGMTPDIYGNLGLAQAFGLPEAPDFPGDENVTVNTSPLDEMGLQAPATSGYFATEDDVFLTSDPREEQRLTAAVRALDENSTLQQVMDAHWGPLGPDAMVSDVRRALDTMRFENPALPNVQQFGVETLAPLTPDQQFAPLAPEAPLSLSAGIAAPAPPSTVEPVAPAAPAPPEQPSSIPAVANAIAVNSMAPIQTAEAPVAPVAGLPAAQVAPITPAAPAAPDALPAPPQAPALDPLAAPAPPAATMTAALDATTLPGVQSIPSTVPGIPSIAAPSPPMSTIDLGVNPIATALPSLPEPVSTLPGAPAAPEAPATIAAPPSPLSGALSAPEAPAPAPSPSIGVASPAPAAGSFSGRVSVGRRPGVPSPPAAPVSNLSGVASPNVAATGFGVGGIQVGQPMWSGGPPAMNLAGDTKINAMGPDYSGPWGINTGQYGNIEGAQQIGQAVKDALGGFMGGTPSPGMFGGGFGVASPGFGSIEGIGGFGGFTGGVDFGGALGDLSQNHGDAFGGMGGLGGLGGGIGTDAAGGVGGIGGDIGGLGDFGGEQDYTGGGFGPDDPDAHGW